MPIKVNFGDAGSDEFTIVEPGIYVAKVYDVEMRTSDTSGKPYLAWDFVLTDEGVEGRHVWTNTSLQPQALWKLRSLLMALGLPEQQLEGEFELEPRELTGKMCQVTVTHETYNGRVYARVSDTLPVSDGVMSTLGGESAHQPPLPTF